MEPLSGDHPNPNLVNYPLSLLNNAFLVRPQPIMFKILPLMLLTTAQKSYPCIMLNIMPIATTVMLQFIYNFIIKIFNEYINTCIVSLQSVMLCIMLCCR